MLKSRPHRSGPVKACTDASHGPKRRNAKQRAGVSRLRANPQRGPSWTPVLPCLGSGEPADQARSSIPRAFSLGLLVPPCPLEDVRGSNPVTGIRHFCPCTIREPVGGDNATHEDGS